MYRILKRILIIKLLIVLVLALTYAVIVLPQYPSNDRPWTTDQAVLPAVQFHKNEVTIKNIRNFDYTSTSTYTPSYYDKTFDLATVRSVDFIVEPFEDLGAAHTFLSFGFEDGSYVAISVEIRKETGESFSPIQGVLRQYELTYVIADERDVIDLRANHRKDTVYLYPTVATPTEARTLFVDMLKRADAVAKEPEFYNTLTNNCTTNIVDHLNTLRTDKLGWDYRMLFPENSDVFAHELGLIAPDMSIEAAREKYRINDRAALHANDPDFSKKIRE
jgi:hypothetical protein